MIMIPVEINAGTHLTGAIEEASQLAKRVNVTVRFTCEVGVLATYFCHPDGRVERNRHSGGIELYDSENGEFKPLKVKVIQAEH